MRRSFPALLVRRRCLVRRRSSSFVVFFQHHGRADFHEDDPKNHDPSASSSHDDRAFLLHHNDKRQMMMTNAPLHSIRIQSSKRFMSTDTAASSTSSTTRRPSDTPKVVMKSADEHWQERTHQWMRHFHEQATKKQQHCHRLTDQEWHEAEELLRYWKSQSTTNGPTSSNRTSVSSKQRDDRNDPMTVGWQLMEGLYQQLCRFPMEESNGILLGSSDTTRRPPTPPCLAEWRKQFQQEHYRPPPSKMPAELTNPWVDQWRRETKDRLQLEQQQHYSSSKNRNTHHHQTSKNRHERSSILPFDAVTPRAMAQRLHTYQSVSLIAMDVKTHTYLLDAASAYQDQPQEGVLFAEEYLQQWMADYREHGAGMLKPDVVAFGSVIQAWLTVTNRTVRPTTTTTTTQQQQQQGNVPISREHVVSVVEDYLTRIMPRMGVQPNQVLYTSLLAAYAKQGQSQKALDFFHKVILKQNHVIPDIYLWNTLLKACAQDTRRPDAAEQAESILRQLLKGRNDDEGVSEADVISYATVMDAWTKRSWKNPTAANRALQLFRQMQDDPHGVTPNVICYNTVLTALSRSGQAQQAEDLLQEMMMASMKKPTSDNRQEEGEEEVVDPHHSTDARPNVNSCTAILSAWAKIGTLEAAQRAHSILTEFMPKAGIESNTECYSSVIHGWAQACRPTKKGQNGKANKSTDATSIALTKAQELFDELQEARNNPNKSETALYPDTISYAALINAYGRSGKPEKAQVILESALEEWNQTKSPFLRPNAQLFTPALSAWSHSRNPEAPEYAEELLEVMIKYHVKPNVFSYTAALNAWAKSSHPSAPLRAKSILETMEAGVVQPNAFSYATVIKAFAKHGYPDEAEEILRKMWVPPDQDVLDDSTRRTVPRPTAYAFTAVLDGWSKAPVTTRGKYDYETAAMRASQLLIEMQQLYDSKQIDEPPNEYCYGSVLQCLSKIPPADSSSSSNDDGAQRCLDFLQVMQTKGLYPNEVCYNIVLHAWEKRRSSSISNEEERKLTDTTIDMLLGEMKAQGLKPNHR